MMCDKQTNDFVFNVKDFPSEYPEELINALNLISNNLNNFHIMGSFKQKSLIYSADIDGLEIIPNI